MRFRASRMQRITATPQTPIASNEARAAASSLRGPVVAVTYGVQLCLLRGLTIRQCRRGERYSLPLNSLRNASKTEPLIYSLPLRQKCRLIGNFQIPKAAQREIWVEAKELCHHTLGLGFLGGQGERAGQKEAGKRVSRIQGHRLPQPVRRFAVLA